MKTCLKCGQEKDESDFGTRKRNSDGKRGRCKKCERVDRLEYLKNPEAREKVRVAQKKWYYKNHEYVLHRSDDWRKKRAQHLFDYRRRRMLEKQYGISIDEYEKLKLSQSGKCLICGSENPNGWGKHFYVDHCHKTGKIRGLLCANCNLAIGQFSDDPKLLRKAAEYVETYGFKENATSQISA